MTAESAALLRSDSAMAASRVRGHFAQTKPRCRFATWFIYSHLNAGIAIVLTPTIADFGNI
jgi:hypothetical protein